uniref:Putative 8.9 kDa family member n=1 Tax=Rhipicephalus pulchellus TaxID=72859 RepID=L7MAD2_RHIPC
MTNLCTCLVIVISGILYLTDVSWQGKYLDFEAYKNGKCHFKGQVYEPGQKMFVKKKCMQWTCIKENSTYGFMVGFTCGTVLAAPTCKRTSMTEGTYPGCCPRVLCP